MRAHGSDEGFMRQPLPAVPLCPGESRLGLYG